MISARAFVMNSRAGRLSAPEGRGIGDLSMSFAHRGEVLPRLIRFAENGFDAGSGSADQRRSV
jgi:hypothetical protein